MVRLTFRFQVYVPEQRPIDPSFVYEDARRVVHRVGMVFDLSNVVRNVSFVCITVCALLGCGSKPSAPTSEEDPRIEVENDDPRVVLMLETMIRIDREALGLKVVPSSIPDTTSILLHLQPKGCDVALHLLDRSVDRTVFFRESLDGYQWLGEMEWYTAPGQSGSWGNPPSEFIFVTYQIEPINDVPIQQLVIRHIRDGSSVSYPQELIREDIDPILQQWKRDREGL